MTVHTKQQRKWSDYTSTCPSWYLKPKSYVLQPNVLWLYHHIQGDVLETSFSMSKDNVHLTVQCAAPTPGPSSLVVATG